jgi:hypothetical protein
MLEVCLRFNKKTTCIRLQYQTDIVTGVLALGAPIAMWESSAMKGSSNLDFKSKYPMSVGALIMSLGVLPMTLGWPRNYIPIQVQKN